MCTLEVCSFYCRPLPQALPGIPLHDPDRKLLNILKASPASSATHGNRKSPDTAVKSGFVDDSMPSLRDWLSVKPVLSAACGFDPHHCCLATVHSFADGSTSSLREPFEQKRKMGAFKSTFDQRQD